MMSKLERMPSNSLLMRSLRSFLGAAVSRRASSSDTSNASLHLRDAEREFQQIRSELECKSKGYCQIQVSLKDEDCTDILNRINPPTWHVRF